MSVLPVRKFALVAMRIDADALIEVLQTIGILHIEPSTTTLVDGELNERIKKENNRRQRLHKAIDFLKRFQAIPTAIPPKNLHEEQLFEQVFALSEESEEVNRRIDATKTIIAELSPFGEFNENAHSLSEVGLSIKLAQLKDKDLCLIKNHAAHHVIGRVGQHNLVVILAAHDADLGVTVIDPPNIPMSKHRASLRDLETRAFALREDASRWAYQLRKLETLWEKTEEQLDRLMELKKAQAFDRLIGLHGFVLQKDVDKLKQALGRHTVALSIDEPNTRDVVPVMLKNPKMLRCFEAIVRAFTGVNYFEKDKTGIVALLFMVFAALCLTDAGYGFLLGIFGYVVALKVHREFGQVFMWAGGFSTILGLLCGQVFGLIFAKDILFNIPPLLTLATDPMVCFKFSLLVGVFCMALANIVAIYQNGIRTHATGCLLAVFGGLTLMVKESGILAGRFYDPVYALNTVALAFFSLGVLSWLFFPEPVFGKEKRIANILWMLYAGPLGLVQDILSHMRLFGIALSGAILALVINKICGLLPAPLGLLFAPIGHFTIFLLSLLSLYIHANRLIFLEFGTKCMSGGNHYFKPFARRT